MAIDIPYEFEEFVKFFYPGTSDNIAGIDEWIEQNPIFRRPHARDVIRTFLDELLSGRHSDQEIEEVWKLQSPSYDFSEGGHRIFLTRVRELLGDR
jgi:hypothetical protein